MRRSLFARLKERFLRWYYNVAPRTQAGTPLTLYLSDPQFAVLRHAARLGRVPMDVFVTQALAAHVERIERKVPLQLVGGISLTDRFAGEPHPCRHFVDAAPPNFRRDQVPGACAKKATGRCDYTAGIAQNCTEFEKLVPLGKTKPR